MSRWATFILFVMIFGLGTLFRGDWIKLAAVGLASGFLIAAIDWRLDRQLRSMDKNPRWAILKFWMVGGILIALLAAGFAYWLSKQDALVSGAAAFLGVGLAAPFCEMMARKRSLA